MLHRLKYTVLGAALMWAAIAFATSFTVVSVNDGSLSSPGFQFNSDSNTGFRRTGSGTVAYVADGADAVTLSSTGCAGCVTASNPVNVGTQATGTLLVTNGGTNLTAAADDNVMTGNGTTWESKALTSCSGASNAVTYNTTTNAWGCNTITGLAQTSSSTTVTWVTGCSNDPTGTVTYVQTGNTVTIQLTTDVTCTSDGTAWQTATGALPAAIRPTRAQSLKYTDTSINAVETDTCITVQPDGQMQFHTTATCGTNPGNVAKSYVAANQTALTYLLN